MLYSSELRAVPAFDLEVIAVGAKIARRDEEVFDFASGVDVLDPNSSLGHDWPQVAARVNGPDRVLKGPAERRPADEVVAAEPESDFLARSEDRPAAQFEADGLRGERGQLPFPESRPFGEGIRQWRQFGEAEFVDDAAFAEFVRKGR